MTFLIKINCSFVPKRWCSSTCMSISNALFFFKENTTDINEVKYLYGSNGMFASEQEVFVRTLCKNYIFCKHLLQLKRCFSYRYALFRMLQTYEARERKIVNNNTINCEVDLMKSNNRVVLHLFIWRKWWVVVSVNSYKDCSSK